jgi:hypothetical protein
MRLSHRLMMFSQKKLGGKIRDVDCMQSGISIIPKALGWVSAYQFSHGVRSYDVFGLMAW